MGELSIMMVSRRSRPTCERSLTKVSRQSSQEQRPVDTNLDVVALMVVAALTEKPMMNNLVNIQLVKQRISVLACVSPEAIQ